MIIVNGEPAEGITGLTISDLLAARQCDPLRVAVERNGQIVPRAQYGQVHLSDGDTLEIVQFVGGG